MILKSIFNNFRIIIICLAFSINLHGQYESFSQSFDLLTTLAGKGDIQNKAENGWLTEFEGKSAINAELSRPHMAMADSAGNIYIADKDAHAIRKVSTNGIITTAAGTNAAGDGGEGIATQQAINAPNGVWVNKKGAFYLLDLGNNKIRKVDTEGNMTTVVHDEGGISLGRGLWLSKTEDTIWYSSGSQIKMWTQDSGIVSYATGFSGLGNIVQDANGHIIATDRTGNKVYRTDKEGNKQTIAGTGSGVGGGDGFPAIETAFDGVRGVWFLEDNTYFLATHEGSQVWYVDSESIAHLFLNGREGDDNYSGDGENYQTPGYKISEARAVSVDYQGNVIVTENDRGFIRKIEKKVVDAILKGFMQESVPLQIFPNPSNGTFQIGYTLPAPGRVDISILNSQGQIIENLMSEKVVSPILELQWQSSGLPAGIYFISLRCEGRNVTKKLIITD